MTEPTDRRSGSGHKEPEPAKEAPEEKSERNSDTAPDNESVSHAFLQLVQMLFVQTMITLGEMENPATGKKEADLPIAKTQIAFLEMLEAKTQGNLSEAESSYLGECLHQSRMLYMAKSKGA